jgi:hypothetical protein
MYDPTHESYTASVQDNVIHRLLTVAAPKCEASEGKLASLLLL